MALASGVLSFVCLFGFGGLLAIGLGWLAHGEIERSEGRIDGKGLANAGIGLGIANVVLSVVGLGILIALAVRPEPFVASRGGSPPPHLASAPPAPALPAPAPVPPQREAEDDAGEAEAEVVPPLPVLPAQIGKIAIVEASTQTALEQQLLAQLKESARSGERVLLWTVTSPCEPCAAVGRALPDARMQRALSGVRLVRADAHAFAVDLQRLGVPTEFVPGFTLLDGGARPVDHIYGGEWDDDIPANIAPILDKFMRRTLSPRRHQWSRPLREGETPL